MKTGNVLVLGLALAGFAAPQQPKKAIEIEAFDYSSVMTSVQAIFGTQMNIGQGIQAMMTTRVQQGGKFTVVERRKIATALKEQDFDASNRVKHGTGARIGQVRGADLSLAGDIVVFGRDDRHKGAGAGALVGGTGAAIGGYKNDAKAVVVLDYRIIDMETSEVVATGEARGESKRSSKGFGAGLLVGWTGGGVGANMGMLQLRGNHYRRGHHGRRQSARSADRGQALQGGAESRANDLDALVADVSGNTIIINSGAAPVCSPA